VIAFILRKLATLAPTFLGITLIAFALIHAIPGDPVEVMVGEHMLDPVAHQEALHRLGLDLPLPVQYGHYLLQLLHGNLGDSLATHEPIWNDFLARFPATIELSLVAIVLAVLVGIPMGVIAAIKRGSLVDRAAMGLALTGYSMPIFWWGLMLIKVFSVQLGWTPVSGRIGIEFDIDPHTGFMLIDVLMAPDKGAFCSAVLHLVLPGIVLATVPMAVIARMTRSSMLEVLREDYIRAARARGLSPFRVVIVHGLRNALLPVITVIGLQTGSLLAGAVLTETVFAWPGIGKWLVDAILNRDYPVAQAGILIVATVIVAVNFLVDVLYGVVNPRLRGGAA